ncbi:MAG TPA: hypothetical protein PLI18_17255 [Pirellulaceae bacterium]|nr:hypothetical protein [Pirellulaceae bacterium]
MRRSFLLAVAACLCLVSSGPIGLASLRASDDGDGALRDLRAWIAEPSAERAPLAEQAFAAVALDRSQAEAAAKLLIDDHAARRRAALPDGLASGELTVDGVTMKFAYRKFGEPTATGRSLYLSMHGGGGAPARVNDGQWENQKRLYEPAEGVYLAPRAPGNTWDLWHQGHIDPLFDRLIADLIVVEGVDPNRVYLMGYSAGGDGVYQLAPRMADRFAAAAMMAGHPNETSPLGLRNLPFAIYCGGRDSAYDRNKIAEQWGKTLDELAAADEGGYPHRTVIYPDKGHWMDREDAEALPWMAQQVRNLRPDRVVWKQDDVIGTRFYWLAMSAEAGADRTLVDVRREGGTFVVERASKSLELTIRLDDSMTDLDAPIKVIEGDTVLFEGKANRTIATLAKTLEERGDPTGLFSAEVRVTIEPRREE